MSERRDADLIVVGSGVAGLSAALAARGLRVLVLSAAEPGQDGSSAWAQGGIAAAVGDGDGPDQHAADTLAAGCFHGRPQAVRKMVEAAREVIAWLESLGLRFDRQPDGRLHFAHEAAHGRPRVLHAGGDASGCALIGTLLTAARRAPWIEWMPQTRVEALLKAGRRVVGVRARGPDGDLRTLRAPRVLLATGGIGQLFRWTSNPPGLWGSGLWLAAEAGARLADLEFVQFHPTALAVGPGPQLPLLTEALRGAGARLLDGRGRRLLEDLDPRLELAPRDVVARAVWQAEADGDGAWLDVRPLGRARLEQRFPAFLANLAAAGLDPLDSPVPVRVAAHFHMGGIAVDLAGRSSVPGLYAVGEVACSGVHGANRLASNSLLEGLVFGRRLGARLARARPLECPAGEPTAVGPLQEPDDGLRAAVWSALGPVRRVEGLAQLIERLRALDPDRRRGAPAVALCIAEAALARKTSLGAHWLEPAQGTSRRTALPGLGHGLLA